MALAALHRLSCRVALLALPIQICTPIATLAAPTADPAEHCRTLHPVRQSLYEYCVKEETPAIERIATEKMPELLNVCHRVNTTWRGVKACMQRTARQGLQQPGQLDVEAVFGTSAARYGQT